MSDRHQPTDPRELAAFWDRHGIPYEWIGDYPFPDVEAHLSWLRSWQQDLIDKGPWSPDPRYVEGDDFPWKAWLKSEDGRECFYGSFASRKEAERGCWDSCWIKNEQEAEDGGSGLSDL